MQWLRLAPGIDAVPLEDALLLKSDFVALRLEGASAAMVGERVVPFLREWRRFEDLAAHLSDYDAAAIRALAEQLTAAGVLSSTATAPPDRGEPSPWHDWLAVLGVPLAEARARLHDWRIAVFGLEAVGAHIAVALAQLGVGSLTLADPGLLVDGDLAAMPPLPGARSGVPRQQAVAALLRTLPWGTRLSEFPGEALTKDGVREVLGQVDFAVGACDRALGAAHHWINAAALATGLPALYCDLAGTRAFVGPTVFPGETACYMCWRMRYIAAREDFTEAMAYEQAMDKTKEARGHTRPVFPPLAGWAASLAALEVVRIGLGLASPQTGNQVLELNALELTMQSHRFLHRPDCPSCRGQLAAVRRGLPDDGR